MSVCWSAGEQLSTGWDPILRILEAVPEAEEAASVGLAFQSVQLLASDYMSSLPPSLLRKYLEIAALYGAQQVCRAAFCVCPSVPWHGIFGRSVETFQTALRLKTRIHPCKQ